MLKLTQEQYDKSHADFKGLWSIERTDWPDWDAIKERYMGKRTITHHGALLVEGVGLEITPNEPRPESRKVYLREIGQALKAKLYEQPNTHLHWVAVIGEDSVQPEPVKEWYFNDALIQVGIVEGNGEGCFVYVHVQKDRYFPDHLIALFRIKFLCSATHVFRDAADVFEFFKSKEFLAMTRNT
ncbi:hypothetical protein LP417_35610 (plasmid) [Polaromonas sp. P1-6]|nr:hypothetical protein LP417_35610 [Polaromonas sp. P1-6]